MISHNYYIMCWNSEVSLNTFIFSSFVLLLIIYNNTYTQYKIKELTVYWYIFLFSVILMQLIEHFIWKNINNPLYNRIFSLSAFIVLFFQPIASIMLVKSLQLKQNMIIFYLILALPYLFYKIVYTHINSTVTHLGHLQWNFNVNLIIWFIWLFFLFFSFFYNGYYFNSIIGIIGLILLIIVTYNYYYDNSLGSMWCWVINSIMIYYAGYLLLYLPFCEKNRIC